METILAWFQICNLNRPSSVEVSTWSENLISKPREMGEFMQEFDYDISYINGKQNVVADALSRQYKESYEPSKNIIRNLMALTSVKINSDLC